MSSNLPRKWTSAIMLSVVLSCITVLAYSSDSVKLSVVPNRCISLLKGKTCYQAVQFRWKLQDAASVINPICLWREGQSVALNCWEGQSEGFFRYSLEAAETTSFHLVTGKRKQPIIGSTSVTVNWVYNNRSSRRGRWRLF